MEFLVIRCLIDGWYEWWGLFIFFVCGINIVCVVFGRGYYFIVGVKLLVSYLNY